jgi:hypothetical protein
LRSPNNGLNIEEASENLNSSCKRCGEIREFTKANRLLPLFLKNSSSEEKHSSPEESSEKQEQEEDLLLCLNTQALLNVAMAKLRFPFHQVSARFRIVYGDHRDNFRNYMVRTKVAGNGEIVEEETEQHRRNSKKLSTNTGRSSKSSTTMDVDQQEPPLKHKVDFGKQQYKR